MARRRAALGGAKGKATWDSGRVSTERAWLLGDSGPVLTNRGSGRWQWCSKWLRVREGLYFLLLSTCLLRSPLSFLCVSAVSFVHVRPQRALRAHVRPKRRRTAPCASVVSAFPLPGLAGTGRPAMRSVERGIPYVLPCCPAMILSGGSPCEVAPLIIHQGGGHSVAPSAKTPSSMLPRSGTYPPICPSLHLIPHEACWPWATPNRHGPQTRPSIPIQAHHGDDPPSSAST